MLYNSQYIFWVVNKVLYWTSMNYMFPFFVRVNGSWQGILSEQDIKVNFGIGQIKESSRLVCLKNWYKIYWRESGNPSSDKMKSWTIIVGKSMIVKKIDFGTRKFKFESWHHYFLDIRLYSSCSICNMRIITIL